MRVHGSFYQIIYFFNTLGFSKIIWPEYFFWKLKFLKKKVELHFFSPGEIFKSQSIKYVLVKDPLTRILYIFVVFVFFID